jgi:hypothetical protein
MYRVTLQAHGREVGHAATPVAADVVACARSWLAGVAYDQFDGPLFTDPGLRETRVLNALARKFDPQLQWHLQGNMLRVRYDDRSCSFACESDGIAGSFECKYGMLASAALDDAIPAVSAWLLARVPVHRLATIIPSLEIVSRADILEVDPARWRWLDLRDKFQYSHLPELLLPLVEVLAASPIAATFYTYMSVLRLCFSASSHYPWVDYGLPIVTDGEFQELQDPRMSNRLVVAAVDDGTYQIGAERYNLARTKELIEQALAESPLRPFFGRGQR